MGLYSLSAIVYSIHYRGDFLVVVVSEGAERYFWYYFLVVWLIRYMLLSIVYAFFKIYSYTDISEWVSPYYLPVNVRHKWNVAKWIEIQLPHYAAIPFPYQIKQIVRIC